MLRCCSRRATPLLRRAAVAEQPLEHDLRIDLHRQRTRRRRPRNRVRVDAAVALAAVARVRARILDRELQRRQRACPGRSAARSSGRCVVPRSMSAPVVLLRLHAAKVRRRDEVIRARDARRILRRLRPQPARDHRLVCGPSRAACRCTGSSKSALTARHPVARRRAVRHEDAA